MWKEGTNLEADILIVEDNEISSHVLNSYIERLGLLASIACDGREGVELVKKRKDARVKPFGLILMDIHMPVMSGIEAADAIFELCGSARIIAVTPNADPLDIALYKEHGMCGCLEKPFSFHGLHACLSEYFTLADEDSVSYNESEDKARLEKLYRSFVKRNSNAYKDLIKAIESGDLKGAHRIAHTLKGLAGLMDRPRLQESAIKVEEALKDGLVASKRQLDDLNRELCATLEELARYKTAPVHEKPQMLDKAKAIKLFSELQPLLAGDNARALSYAQKLGDIPQTETLIANIEDCEFEKAILALNELLITLELSDGE